MPWLLRAFALDLGLLLFFDLGLRRFVHLAAFFGGFVFLGQGLFNARDEAGAGEDLDAALLKVVADGLVAAVLLPWFRSAT